MVLLEMDSQGGRGYPVCDLERFTANGSKMFRHYVFIGLIQVPMCPIYPSYVCTSTSIYVG